MKMWILAAGGLVAILAALYLIGRAIPEDHVASVSAEYKASAERIFHAISTPAQFTEWRTGLRKVEITGDIVLEESSFGVMRYRFANAEPGRQLETVDTGTGENGFTGSWKFVIEPTGAGSRLTITEHGRVFSPWFRLMARYLFGYESTMKQYHADLARYLG